ncbi:MAG: trypsin-like serine protease [Myxococcota bacterium]|nr:trypsin-like serine protease [Myxococcota bacterium]
MSTFWIGLGLSTAVAGGTEASPKIINGEEATAQDYPMTGGMLMDANLSFGGAGAQDIRTFVCSSTLIAPDVVLVAAHCIDPYAFTFGFGELNDVDIRWSRLADLSAHDGSEKAPWPEDAVKAWDWVMHPSWNLQELSMGVSVNYDIGLLFLEEPVLDVDPAVLITADEAEQIVEGALVDVVGWGQQVATSTWESPPAGSYGYKIMGTSTIDELGSHEFHVGEASADVRKCHGDSGGPSFMEVDSDSSEPLRLVGVTSHAYDQSDCNETGGVDTRVDAYLGWIDAEMASRCVEGSRAWCEEFGVLPPPVANTGEDTGLGDGEDPAGGCACSSSSPTSGWSGFGLVAVLGWIGSRRRQARS